MRSAVEHVLQNIRLTGDAIEAEAFFSPALPIFEGHFPGRPIVPAVYQIALCRIAVETFRKARLCQVVRSRFSAECLPDVGYDLKISLDENEGSVVATCSIKQGDVIHSKIVLLFGKQAA